jgi:hypothetical protein
MLVSSILPRKQVQGPATHCCPEATADCTVAERMFSGSAAMTTSAICQEAVKPSTSEISSVNSTCACRATELPNPTSTRRVSEASLVVSSPAKTATYSEVGQVTLAMESTCVVLFVVEEAYLPAQECFEHVAAQSERQPLSHLQYFYWS